jgi:hypothetical protein
VTRCSRRCRAPTLSAARTLLGLTEGAGAGSWVAVVDASQLIAGIRRTPLAEISKNNLRMQHDAVAMKVTDL